MYWQVVKLAKEEALSRSDLDQTSYDCFLLNLRLETSAIKVCFCVYEYIQIHTHIFYVCSCVWAEYVFFN